MSFLKTAANKAARGQIGAHARREGPERRKCSAGVENNAAAAARPRPRTL